MDREYFIVYGLFCCAKIGEKIGITKFLMKKVENVWITAQNILPLHLIKTKQPKMTYEESASQLYQDLTEALALPNVRDTYREFGRVLRVAADQKTTSDALYFGSLFAKIDYLSKQYQMDQHLVQMINDTRVRLRRLLSYEDQELIECKNYDLKAICLFIGAVYQEQPPSALSSLFPSDERRAESGSVVADYFRLYVTRWDDTFVYGHTEEGFREGREDKRGSKSDEGDVVEELKVCYNYNGGFVGGDWTHIRPFLAPDVQLNLVRPRLKDDVYYPELIILWPDFLVDVTTITGCFEEYAHDPYLYLINKLIKMTDSSATLLGNLASQLLDEAVHQKEKEKDYDESYADFVRANAFKVLTTDLGTLKADGEKQKYHIRRALTEGLQQRVGRYRREEVMLEPSFFSEMLGIQGRMDLLQLDYKVLVEQKSGKGTYVRGARPDDPPRPQTKYFVQVLLYLAILNYNYQMPNREVQAMLLYSKYANGLIGVAPAPAVLFEAFVLRNLIAGLESRCCRGGWKMLNRLNAGYFRQKGVTDNFWDVYILPKLNAILDPIHRASDLERAYFYRFLTFLANEQTYSKVGNKTKESSGFAAKWHDSLEEKYQSGNIYDQLALLSPNGQHEGAVVRLEFGFAQDRACDMSNFRVGDIVIAYPYRREEEPDARRTMVFRASISDISADSITLELRAPQSDKHVFVRNRAEEYYWAIEHDFMEASYRSQYSGMHAFLTAPKERRDLLMMQRVPRIHEELRLKGDYGRFNELALRVKQAADFFLIIGPPGTGKTSYGMLYTLKEQLMEPNSNVLILSFTNRAVDEICSKLVEEGIDFLRVGNRLGCAPEYRSFLLDNRLKEYSGLTEMRELVERTRVLVGTTASLSSSIPIFRLKTFDLAIIDEASQILEPHLLPLLSAKTDDDSAAIRKFVMIGDHKQLPAVVQQSPDMSRVEEPLLQSIGLTDCRLSLFERLLKQYNGNPKLVYMLTHQGRMHQEIADFPNQAFYGGRLHVVPLEHQVEPLPKTGGSVNGIDNLLLTRRLAFLATEAPDPIVSDKVNPIEARMIAATVERIYRLCIQDFDAARTVGVIVPYRNQIAAVRNAIDAYGHPVLHDITIDTVERYQGSQRDYILYGFTVQRTYQLNFLSNNTFEEDGQLIDRKLNVAMTRARKHLMLFGNPAVICQDPVFDKLVSYVKSHDCWYDVDADKYVTGQF